MTVRTDDRRHAFGEVQLESRVVAKVGEFESADEHDSTSVVQALRHDEIEIVLRADAAQYCGLDRVARLDRDLVTDDCFDAGSEIFRVEADGHLGPGQRRVDFLDGVAEVLCHHDEAQRVVPHLEAHRRRLAGEDAAATDRFHQLFT